MKRYVINKGGSTLILLVITVAITTVLGASLLSVAMMNFKIKKANTEIRKSFYMSESGLNKAYVDAYELVCDGIIDSKEKVEDYLQIHPLNVDEAENIFINNYKLYITENIENKITNNSNPSVQITNVGALIFFIDKFTVHIQSKYTSKSNIKKTTYVNLIIQIPDYYDMITSTIDISSLLILDNWILSN